MAQLINFLGGQAVTVAQLGIGRQITEAACPVLQGQIDEKGRTVAGLLSGRRNWVRYWSRTCIITEDVA